LLDALEEKLILFMAVGIVFGNFDKLTELENKESLQYQQKTCL